MRQGITGAGPERSEAVVDGGEIIVEYVVRGRVRHAVGLRGHRSVGRRGISSGSGADLEAIRRVLELVGGGRRLAAPSE